MLKLARLLLFGYSASVVFGLAFLHASRNEYSFIEPRRLMLAAGLVVAISVAAYASGLPDVPKTNRSAAFSAAMAVGCAAALFSLVQLFVGDQLLPRLVVLGSSLVLIPLLASTVALSSGGLARAQRRDRVLIVADLDESRELSDELAVETDLAAQIVEMLPIQQAAGPEATLSDSEGGVSTDREKVMASSTLAWAGKNLVETNQPTTLGHANGLLQSVQSRKVSIIVLSRRAQFHESILSQAAVAHASGVRVRSLSSFYEEWLHKLPASELERSSLFFDIREIHVVRYRRLKRLLDLAAGFFGLLLLGLACPFVLLGNAIGNRGVLFYRQPRVGKGGQEFSILKFRTMRETPSGPDDSPWTEREDTRITRFGSFLRKSHLDELPQVINLLTGDLSIVGPRPEQRAYVDRLSKDLPFYELRHLVRPGLTGWAQVNYGYAGSDAGALQKLQYEFYYLQNQSLWLDFRIIARTIRSVVSRSGR
jgi:lipopolysaccharide/colanic/teichoic acid biosynthesis glycosyltransferase